MKFIYGKFKTRSRNCPLCSREYTTHEEKLTDVNLAITLFENALKNTFDKAVIISADSDLIPPIRAIKNLFPEKYVAVLPPYNNSALDLINNAHKKYKMKAKTLLDSQLPDIVLIFNRPHKWSKNNFKFDPATKEYFYQPPTP